MLDTPPGLLWAAVKQPHEELVTNDLSQNPGIFMNKWDFLISSFFSTTTFEAWVESHSLRACVNVSGEKEWD